MAYLFVVSVTGWHNLTVARRAEIIKNFTKGLNSKDQVTAAKFFSMLDRLARSKGGELHKRKNQSL